MTMGTNGTPNDPENARDLDSDRTRTFREPGGAAAGQIGPYQLLELLGEGGMGEVWLAEQKTPIHRTVALKLIKPGMDTKAVIARFESERQALALMDHPAIAHVFDAGSTVEGRPYFVMEYVPGLPITEYCDKHRLSISERLALFVQVCEGVQHAHQKAIIHRDLKPSNVLVLEQGNRAIPKIIDFGLAKAMAQRLTEKTLFTELGVIIGTPEYMSPEQADQREQNIDTRTDVYSLGVILYELLAGALPFDAKALRAAGLAEILRVIREEEPPKPSTKIRSMGEGSAATAEKRREEPRSFARRLSGELDWITMKALEKDRVRRYGTPTELSADIARYLQNEPVVAGPATARYRMKKYAARHRFALGAAAVLVLLLSGFTVAQAVEIHRIRIERDRANRERDRANRITDFMTGMFTVSNPGEARGNTITAREILDKASSQIESGLNQDPETQGQLLNGMGDVYENIGLYPKAESLLRMAVDVFEKQFGPQNRLTLRAKNDLGSLLRKEGHFGEAEKMELETLAGFQGTLGPHRPETLLSMANLADVLNDEGHYSEAEKLAKEAFEGERSMLGPAHDRTIAVMNIYGNIVYREGRYPEAEQIHRSAYEISIKTYGPDSPQAMMSGGNLANDVFMQSKFTETERLDREFLAVQTHVDGPEHPATLETMNNLANALYMEKRYGEAESLYRKTLEVRQRVLGPEHPVTLTSMSNLALLEEAEGHLSDSEKLFRQTVEMERRVLGAENPQTINDMENLGRVFADGHQYSDSEKILRESLAIQTRVRGPNSPLTANTAYNVGCEIARQGRRDEAFSYLRQAVDHGLPATVDLAIDQDPDLKSLHGDPRFAALVAHAKEVAAAAQKAK